MLWMRALSGPGKMCRSLSDPRSLLLLASSAKHVGVPERQVRFTEQFFDRLDTLLPSERGTDGTPSVTDFLLLDYQEFGTGSPPTTNTTPSPPMTPTSGSTSVPAFS
jgi:hypothetical protein